MKHLRKWVFGVFVLVVTLLLVNIPASSASAAIPVGKYTKSIKIAVFSDPHYYARELGTTGTAFQNYLADDRKMLAESDAILRSAIDAIKKSDAQIVLITGDLTKDGELLCHQRFASYLAELTNAGKQVYVINGNHDIYNPHAYRYSGSSQIRVPNISPGDFKRLYHKFGYDKAIAADPNSLSYVVEPVNGLRIIAMDSCIYASTNTASVTSGAFSAERLKWIKEQIKAATAQGKTVIGMMHHGMTAHFGAQPAFYPAYIVNNADQLAKEFSDLGMKVVFTGHFHAQDIAEKATFNSYLADIETGSLVTYPVPYRYVEITPDKKKLKITSKKVTNVNYNTGGVDFQSYAKNFLAQGIKGLFIQELTTILMKQGLPQAQASAQAAVLAEKQIAPPSPTTVSDLFANAMIAHYQGDEKLDAQTKAIYQALAASTDATTQMLGQFLLSIGTDSYPADNNVTIDLTTGKVLN